MKLVEMTYIAAFWVFLIVAVGILGAATTLFVMGGIVACIATAIVCNSKY